MTPTHGSQFINVLYLNQVGMDQERSVSVNHLFPLQHPAAKFFSVGYPRLMSQVAVVAFKQTSCTVNR